MKLDRGFKFSQYSVLGVVEDTCETGLATCFSLTLGPLLLLLLPPLRGYGQPRSLPPPRGPLSAVGVLPRTRGRSSRQRGG